MANNFFGKIRGLVSSAWAEADVQPTHNTQETPTPPASASGGLSGVAKYLAKQATAQGGTEEKALTGVAKYLAKHTPEAPAATASTTPLTSVEKYLAKQAGGAKIEAAKPAAPAAPLSKVDKYLAGQSSAPAKTKTEATPAPAKKAEATEKSAPVAKKKNEVAAKATAVNPKAVAEKKSVPAKAPQTTPIVAESKPADMTDLSAGATQCQAGTTKGTQCRNTLRLNQLQLVVNGKTYLFAACNQHNNDAFKPFQPA